MESIQEFDSPGNRTTFNKFTLFWKIAESLPVLLQKISNDDQSVSPLHSGSYLLKLPHRHGAHPSQCGENHRRDREYELPAT
jgi:hypothetical protein